MLSLTSNFRAEARLPCSSAFLLLILSFSLHVKDRNLMPLVDIFILTTNNAAIILPGTQNNTVPRATVILHNTLSEGVGN
ncbi:hypothetical protein C0J52_26480 [Blattella germanica]|nr:hypothetical protein C0J52_26480 [Blattella germanica]